MIIDDVYDGSTRLSSYLPSGGKGTILITTRSNELNLHANVGCRKVGPMERKEALALLSASLGSSLDSQIGSQGSRIALVELLEGLPLALRQASAYIQFNRISPDEFLKLYSERAIELKPQPDSVRSDQSFHAVWTTWKLAIVFMERMNTQTSWDALDTLYFLAFISGHINVTRLFETIWNFKKTPSQSSPFWPIDQLRVLENPSNADWQPFRLLGSLRLLASFSFIKLDPIGEEVSVHHLFQEFLRSHLSSEELSRYSKITASVLSSAMGASAEGDEDFSFRSALISQMNFYLRLHQEHSAGEINDIHWIGPLSSIAKAFRDNGQMERALDLDITLMNLREKLLGAEDVETLRSASRVSKGLRMLGRPNEARVIGERVYQTRQKVLGDGNNETLESMENLAEAYFMLDRNQEAASLFQNALSWRKELSGARDATMVTGMSQLAASYRRLGRYTEALKLEERVLIHTKESLGNRHPDTLNRMNNLAVTYSEIGRHRTAADIREEVLSVSQEMLGDRHHDSVIAMHNLAASYVKLKQPERAIEIETQALKLSKEVFGTKHPQTQLSISNLATAYEMMGNHQPCLELREEMLRTAELIYGQEHPTTFLAMGGVATSSENIGQHQYAMSVRQRLLQLYQRTLGDGHSSTCQLASELVTSYEILGLEAEAIQLRTNFRLSTRNLRERDETNPLGPSDLESLTLSSNPDTTHSDCSDEASIRSDSTVFSRDMSESTTTTLDDHTDAKASEQFTWILYDDLELVFMYEDLMLLLGRQEFIQRHRKLLKSYLQNVNPTIKGQGKILKFLRRPRQRTMIAEEICDRTSINSLLMRSANEVLGSGVRLDRTRLPDHWIDPTVVPNATNEKLVDDAQDPSSDESDGGANGTNADLNDTKLSHSDKLAQLLTTGAAYSNYKQTLAEMSENECYPSQLRAVVSLGHVDAVRGFIERHFDMIARDEFEWLQELKSLGYEYYQIAELLIDDLTMSPWVFLNQPEAFEPAIRPDYHIPGCVHQDLSRTCLAPRLLLDTLQHPNDVRRIIAEHCGLAGVVPKSRNAESWIGRVTFLDEARSVASITYDTLVSRHLVVVRVCEALRRFCGIVSYLQSKNLCCDSFTILGYSHVEASEVIALRRIYFKPASELLDLLQLLIRNWESPGMISRCLPRLQENASDIILIACDTLGFGSNEGADLESCIDRVSLAVQILTLGIYSYSQAHGGGIHPFCLVNPLSHIYLLGTQSPKHGTSKAHIEVSLSRLTCMAGVAGDAVTVFRTFQALKANKTDVSACDLLALPEDVAETWDACRFITNPGAPHREQIYAIEVGEGFIISANNRFIDPKYPKTQINKLHWSERGQPFDLKWPFSLGEKAIIGTIAVNHSCPVNEDLSWLCANVTMATLGAKNLFWERSEAQVGLQAGQYAIAQFHMTWVKRPGTTLKHVHLKSDVNLPFLQSDWGLQISYCTGIARRVSLCELLADLTPLLMEELLQKPASWNTLYIDKSEFQARKTEANMFRTGISKYYFWMGYTPRIEVLT